jgi:hypothetical protein
MMIGCGPRAKEVLRRSNGHLPAVTVFLLLGCSGLVAPQDDWIEFDPPAWYQDVFDQMVECTKLSRVGYEDIRWFKVMATSVRWHDVEGHGLAFVRENFIIMPACWTESPSVVAHEIIHLLAGTPDHEQGNPIWMCPELVYDPTIIRLCVP